MYPIEHYLNNLNKYVSNRARLEGSIVEGYVVEALTFYTWYLQGVKSKFDKQECHVKGI